MRKFINIFICATFALMSAACNKTDEPMLEMAEGEGVLALNLNLPKLTRAEGSTELPFELKIYRYANAEKSEKELVRKYTSKNDIPKYVWLIEDNYMVQVKTGNRELATFTEKYYVGTADFTITPGEIKEVEVVAYMANIPVAVSYDATVDDYFDEFYTYVSATDNFVLEDAVNGEVPTLKYTQSAKGYFILPDNVSDINWYFYGKAGDKEITKSGTIADAQPLNLYTLNFKYSPDAPGSLFFSASVNPNPEICAPDRIPFSPDPTVKGVDFSADLPYNYDGVTRSYTVKALDRISVMNIAYGATTYDLLDTSATYTGIAVTKVNDKEYTVAISEPFFESFSGGVHTVAFNVKDESGGIGYQECVYNIEGIMPVRSYDLWWLTADFAAISFSSENLTVGYRVSGGEWTYLPVSTTSDNITYTATANDFRAEKNYEYALFANSTQVGKSLTVTTAAGPQIPEAGFESWSTASDKARCPAANPNAPFWDTGNHATARLVGKQLTTESTDVRSGATGVYSAYMGSIKAAWNGIGKFAAGNLFVGRFVSIDGMGGIVEFGREFNFSARPKKLRFWMKNNEGTINEGSHTTGTDIAKVYCCFTDRKYTVNTNKEETLFNPALTTEGVLATATWQSSESHAEWTMMELDIEYKEGMTTKPTQLVMTFTCSGYGDYFTGSTNSWMMVDDVEFVY